MSNNLRFFATSFTTSLIIAGLWPALSPSAQAQAQNVPIRPADIVKNYPVSLPVQVLAFRMNFEDGQQHLPTIQSPDQLKCINSELAALKAVAEKAVGGTEGFKNDILKNHMIFEIMNQDETSGKSSDLELTIHSILNLGGPSIIRINTFLSLDQKHHPQCQLIKADTIEKWLKNRVDPVVTFADEHVGKTPSSAQLRH
jgi:hypothetical protein